MTDPTGMAPMDDIYIKQKKDESTKVFVYKTNEKNRYFVKQDGEYKKVDLSTQKGVEQLAKRFKQSGQLAAYAWASETSNDRAGIPVNEEVADAAVKGGTRAARDDPRMQLVIGTVTGGEVGAFARVVGKLGTAATALFKSKYIVPGAYKKVSLEPVQVMREKMRQIEKFGGYLLRKMEKVVRPLPNRSHNAFE
jgi:hypothetical protein